MGNRLQHAGVVYDLNASLPELSHLISGYITRDTQEWLDGTRQFSRVYLRVADPDNTRTTWRIAEQAAVRIERSGGRVNSILVPTPGSHPKESVLNRVLLLLGILAVLTLVLSSFLVTNIISAILTEQVRQIGLMKAIGARSRQLVEMYLGMVLIFALLALLIAVPLGAGAAYAFTRMLAYIFNVDVAGFSPPPVVLALQVTVGLATPLLATLYPVLKATRVTAYQAINDYGLGQSHFGHGALDRLTMSPRLRGLPRPLLIALRNTFRRKARLAITLLTLTVASTVFVGVFGVRASLVRTFDLALSCWQYDVSVNFNRPERITRLQREALRLPGVLAVEGWNSQPMRRLRADSSLSREMTLIALPATTAMFKPILVEGRWPLPGDGVSQQGHDHLGQQVIRLAHVGIVTQDARLAKVAIVGVVILNGVKDHRQARELAPNGDRAGSVVWQSIPCWQRRPSCHTACWSYRHPESATRLRNRDDRQHCVVDKSFARLLPSG